mgnify:CR=1 FL=1
MKQSSYKGKSPLPDFVIDAACADDTALRLLREADCHAIVTQRPKPWSVSCSIMTAISISCVPGRSMTAAASLISALTSI